MKYFSIKSAARVFVYRAPCHMGKSFNALSLLVKKELKHEPGSGDLYLFLNKRRTYVKVLFYAEGGLCIFAKVVPGKFAANILTAKTLSLAELENALNKPAREKIALAA